MSNVNMSELLTELGLDELQGIDQAQVAENFMPAAIIGLSDGDLDALHLPLSGSEAELYGDSRFGEGKVAKAVHERALENGMEPGNFYNFQMIATQVALGPNGLVSSLPVGNAVRIFPEAVTIDDDPIALPHSPSLVIDYAACLSSRSYLVDQLEFAKTGSPFTYSPLTRFPFTNGVLAGSYDALFGEGYTKAVLDGRLYIGREDGVASATDEMIKAQEENDAPTEIADIILNLNTQHTTEEDTKQGIENSATLLRQGGMLIVRSLAKPAVGEIGTDMITDWAFEAGFDESAGLTYEHERQATLATYLVHGHSGNRDVKTVVLTK